MNNAEIVLELLNIDEGFYRHKEDPILKVSEKIVEIKLEDWEYAFKECLGGYEPLTSCITKGEFGKCMLIIYTSLASTEAYLQWIYSYKGTLLTKYYYIP